jgi:hypothetical protein
MKRIALALLLVTSSASARNQCHEVSDTVGERKCTAFGQTWSTEKSIPVFIGIGAWSSLVQPTGSAFSGTLRGKNGENPVAFDSASFIRGPIQSYGFDIRLGGYFARYGYVAFDWGLALGQARGDTLTTGGYQLSPSSGVNFFHARVGPAVGVRIPLGFMSLRVEGLTALQVLILSTEVNGPDGTRKNGGTGGAMLAVAPRVAADFWVTPDTTLTAWAASNVLRSGDHSFGLSIAAHVRAFDGAF